MFKLNRKYKWLIFFTPAIAAFLMLNSCGLVLPTSLSPFASDIKYHGKIIDSDTLEPIEDALVVGIWEEWKGAGMLAFDDRIRYAREALTDSNGEWTIIGPKGQSLGDPDERICLSYMFGYLLYEPGFTVYKSGYIYKKDFEAYPYVNMRRNNEGIVLYRRGEEWKRLKEYGRAYQSGLMPLIPIKEPEEKLRKLDFSFHYPANLDSLIPLGWQDCIPVRFNKYDFGFTKPQGVFTVEGVKRNKSITDSIKIPDRDKKKVPILIKMLRKEGKSDLLILVD